MHPYLPHLLADIKAGHNYENAEPEDTSDDLENQLREVDRLVSGDGEQTLSYFCRLSAEDFPPGNLFTDEEKLQVCKAFIKMLHSWGADIAFPDPLPIQNRYDLIIGLLDKEFMPLKYGVYVYDFCTGSASDCELGEYCPCLKYVDDDL